MARIGKTTHLAGPTSTGKYKATPEHIAAAKIRIRDQGFDVTLRGCLQKNSTPKSVPEEEEPTASEQE